MKTAPHFLLIAVGTYILLLYFPWQTMVVWAGIIGFIFPFVRSHNSYLSAFSAILTSWIFLAVVADSLNTNIFSAKIQPYLLHYTKPALFVLPGMLGGLLAGFGSLTGCLLRKLVSGEPANTEQTVA